MERPALTTLGEDESLFRATVRAFAEERLRPLAAEMDREAKLHPEVISWLFELGLMGVEIPEPGGAGQLLHEHPRGRGTRSRRPVGGGRRRRPEHAGQQLRLRWSATTSRSERYLPQAGQRVGRLLRTQRSGLGLATRSRSRRRAERAGRPAGCCNGRKLWITNARREPAVHRVRQRGSGSGYKGITAFLDRARLRPASASARRKTSSAFARRAPAS